MHLGRQIWILCLQNYKSVVNISFWYIIMLVTDLHVASMLVSSKRLKIVTNTNDVSNITITSKWTSISFVDIKVIVLNNGHFEQFFLQKWPFISIQHIMVILIWITVILVWNYGQFGHYFFELTVISLCPKWPLFKNEK